MGIAVSDVGAYLGVDVVLSRRTRRQKAVSRDRLLQWRARRFLQMHKYGRHMRVGIRMVFKQGPKLAHTYGMRCLGLPPARLRKLRTATLAARPGMGTN